MELLIPKLSKIIRNQDNYLFCCNYEQLSQNNQCTWSSEGIPSKVWEDFFQKKPSHHEGTKTFWAKKLWGGCSRLED